LEKCGLCKQEKELKVSHIIPAFVGRWMKRESPTHFLRKIEEPNIRQQDIGKLKLLCGDCEGLFSSWETKFAEKIFHPYQEIRNRDNGSFSFEYEDWLYRFATSLAWRTPYRSLAYAERDFPHLLPVINKALKTWEDYLLGVKPSPGHYEQNIMFLNKVKGAQSVSVPPYFHVYTLGAVDSTLAHGKTVIGAYTLLPAIVFWAPMKPWKELTWKNTSIHPLKGTVKSPQKFGEGSFEEFFIDRASQVAEKMDDISPNQREKIRQALVADPDAFAESSTYQSMLADALWQRLQGTP
jgi:hypothetical protein